ncbi:MAG: PAS-domain containing protein [Bradyrhizobium sp.]|uniref:PAS-domain containing protein n=1 Tax=Bradyrhizobium sp. TaxID=376 RepID=UPI001D80B715|nr:PAS-domain containing protein [Bradyrhizobium sp.]MBV9563671.1 PAS-domain containing protein [Bradyrhizobium sp.]
MQAAAPHAERRKITENLRTKWPVRMFLDWVDELSLAEKLYGIVALSVAITACVLIMSVQSARLQGGYRQLAASSGTAAIQIGRVNALIYAIVMESRGIYMSTDRTTVKHFADELLRRNHELAEATAELEEAMSGNGQFPPFKERILQFIDFRKELARRGTEIGPASARAWGDNEPNRALRTQLNLDLEELARNYHERAEEAAVLRGLGQSANGYLFLLGLVLLLFAGGNLYIVRHSVIAPLSHIIETSHRITRGEIDREIPYAYRGDEIGQLATAMQSFRDAVARTFELKQIELAVTEQRDTALADLGRFSDKYFETKWQLTAAIDCMPAGMIMLDSKATVIAINERYRKMYWLPETIKAGSSLQEVLQHGVDSGQFAGDAAEHAAAIVKRISKREPTTVEVTLRDQRIIRIQETPIDGGSWGAMHEDITEERQRQRILKRTERFLATLIENIPEGIIAKDARNLRYVFVNRAAEEMIGMSRAEIVGKTARELFAPATAELIERRDRQMLAQGQQPRPIIDTMDNPRRGRRTVAVRRLQIGGAEDDSHLFVSMFEDRTRETEIGPQDAAPPLNQAAAPG